MIKPVNKDVSLNCSKTNYPELTDRLMVELEDKSEFVCYGTNCPSGYCTSGYTK